MEKSAFQKARDSYKPVLPKGLRPAGLVELLGDILCKLQVALVLGNLVQEHGGLQDAAGRHAHILSAVDDGLSVGAHLRYGVSQQPLCCLERTLVACLLIPLDAAGSS